METDRTTPPVNPWLSLHEGSLPPYVSPGDETFLDRYHRAIGSANNFRLQTDLLPEPFLGDFSACRVLLLGGNPGFDDANLVEHRDVSFRRASLASLHQRPDREYGLHLLDPAFRDFKGYDWWSRRLRALIDALGGSDAGRSQVARHVCVAELFPYHSQNLNFDASLRGLPSFTFTRHLIDTAVERGAIVVVMRSRRHWVELLGSLPSGYMECSNAQQPHISPGNLGRDFDLVVEAVGGRTEPNAGDPDPQWDEATDPSPHPSVDRQSVIDRLTLLGFRVSSVTAGYIRLESASRRTTLYAHELRRRGCRLDSRGSLATHMHALVPRSGADTRDYFQWEGPALAHLIDTLETLGPEWLAENE